MFLSTKKLWMGMALVASLGYSCQHDESLGVEAITGFKIALVDEPSVTETRSTPQELGKPTTDNFTLKIVNSASGKCIYDAGYTKDIIKASAGVYDVTASFGDNAVLAYDAPYYEGKKEDIAIEEGNTASVTVECAVANALASVTFEDSKKFKELYSSYAVEVAVENSSLKLEDGDKRSAYYRANSKPTFTFKGVLKETGKSVEAVLENEVLDDPATFAAKAHCRLTLALKDIVPGVIPTITKAEVETVTVSETLPMEWLPAPKISATGFGENRTLDVYETAEVASASIDFTVAQSLQDLSFTLNFADESFQSLNKTYQLSTMTEDEKQSFKDAGITLPQIGSANPQMIFPKEFISMLHSNNEGTVTNTLTINHVKANDRENVDAQTYTIAVHKPEFTVSVLPGNIWTKEFTVSALTEEQVEKGDFSKLSQNMTYQFSTDGSTDWTDLGEDLRKAELTPNTSYFVRGVYRNEICSAPVEVKTYPIIELENGDMEDWSYEVTNDVREELTKNKDYIYWKKWFPWESTLIPSIWNTVNQTTTKDGNSPDVQWYPFVGTVSNPPYVGCCYVANSGTIPTSDSHSGQAALLKTVGWGSGSTGGGDKSIIKNVTPAELYLGTYDLASHTPVYGIDYASRPTQLKFWCKYEPKSTDLLVAQIVILDKDGKVVGDASLDSSESGSTDWTEKILTIQYSDLLNEPAKMYILFKSGTLTDTSIMDKPGFGNLSDGESVGSKLYIDDISLVYDK